jgi:hypothetical protein
MSGDLKTRPSSVFGVELSLIFLPGGMVHVLGFGIVDFAVLE